MSHDPLPGSAAPTLTVSGRCEACSDGDRNVIHGTPWCPEIPAVVMIDSNMWGSLDAKDRDEIVGLMESRPVVVGEVVILADFDNFMCYGRCVRHDHYRRASDFTYLEEAEK